MRENGLQRPFNSMQIGTWLLLPVLLLQFLFFVSPLLPLAASIPCTVLFFLFGSVASYFAYVTCKTNPIDDRLARHLRRQEEAQNGGAKGETPPENEDESGETKFCWICQCSVNEHAMHCKFCDKCVSNFDHHCLWLNTCIGSPNYQYFFKTVVATFFFVLVHLGCLVGIVVPYFLQRFTRDPPSGAMYDRMEGWFGAGSSEAVAGVNCFFLVVSLVSISLLGQLMFFHMGLRKEGITTYAYIVRDNAKKREKTRRDAEAKSKRILAMRVANEKGDAGEVCRLRMGAPPCCAPCDPIRQKMRENDKAAEAEKAAGDGSDGDDNSQSSSAPVRGGDLENGQDAEEKPTNEE